MNSVRLDCGCDAPCFAPPEQAIALRTNYFEELGYAYPLLGGIDLVFVGPEVNGPSTGKLRFKPLSAARNDASPVVPASVCELSHGPSPPMRAAFYKGTTQVRDGPGSNVLVLRLFHCVCRNSWKPMVTCLALATLFL